MAENTLKIVLHEPGIPQNTGNIGRTCVATGTELHLIKPYGFTIGEKELRRAGLDYWPKLRFFEYESYGDFLKKNPGARVWYATTKARKCYTEVSYGPADFLMFGNESRGIPEEILVRHPDTCVRIPMWGDIRSLNLSNAAAVVLYEALRQQSFFGLNKGGELHRLRWED